MDDTIDTFLGQLEHPDEGVRRVAVGSLEARPCLQSFEALSWVAAKSRDAGVRRQAAAAAETVARGLWRRFTEQVGRLRRPVGRPVDAVAAGLATDDAEVRSAAVTAAALLRCPSAAERLRQVADAPGAAEALRCEALQAVGFLGGKGDVTFLVARAVDGTRATARAAVIGLAAMRKARSYAGLCRFLGGEAAGLALRYLRRLPVGQLEKLLRTMVASPRKADAGWAIEACRQLRPPSSAELLAMAERHESQSVAATARQVAEELAQPVEDSGILDLAELARVVETCDVARVPRLVAHLACEADPKLRAGLVSTLGILGGVEHVDALLASLDDEDGRVRANAIEALGALRARLGPGRWTGLVVPRLVRCLEDEVNRVRANAALALLPERLDAVRWTLEDLIYCGGAAEQKSALYVIETAGGGEFRGLVRYLAREGADDVRGRAAALRRSSHTVGADLQDALAQSFGEELRQSMDGMKRADLPV